MKLSILEIVPAFHDTFDRQAAKMARRGVPNEDLSNIEFETSEEVEVVPTFNSMVSNIRGNILILMIFAIDILCQFLNRKNNEMFILTLFVEST